jgi:hypothetical protein
MLNGTKVNNANAKKYSNYYLANSFFIQDNLLWVRVQLRGKLSRVCVVLPSTKINRVLKDGHGTLFIAHEGVAKTRYRVAQNYSLPSAQNQIKEFMLIYLERSQPRRCFFKFL